MIKTHITDGSGDNTAAKVTNDTGEVNSLVVATRPLKTFENSIVFFMNSDYGVDMNINTASSGSPNHIHDGTDNTEADSGTTDGTTADKLVDSGQNFDVTVYSGMTVYNVTDDTYALVTAVDSGSILSLDTDIMATAEDYTVGAYWTGTTISGTAVEFSKDDGINHTDGGALSVKVEENLNTIWQFAKGSDVVMSSYVSLTIWIYVDKDWKVGDSVEMYGWDTDTGTQVGTSVFLENYFSYDTYDVWQKIVIPLTDFGILTSSTTTNALRCKIAALDGKKAKFYMDDIALEKSGEPVKFTITPTEGTWLHVKEFMISVASDINGTLENATMPFLAYDSLLGVTLAAGINYQRVQDTKTVFSLTVKDLLGFVQLPSATISGYGSDGANTWVTLRMLMTEPIILKSESDDELSFSISDDLSDLLRLRISAGCKVEKREPKY